jgi:hypothetical protein
MRLKLKYDEPLSSFDFKFDLRRYLLVHKKGDVCVSCGGRFVRSFTTFEHLPMVEFEAGACTRPLFGST